MRFGHRAEGSQRRRIAERVGSGWGPVGIGGAVICWCGVSFRTRFVCPGPPGNEQTQTSSG